MKVCYLLQTHKNLSQIVRLVRTIKTLSPHAKILISHSPQNFVLDPAIFQDLSDISIIDAVAGRGRFELVQSYLDALEWLLKNGGDFDWVISLSGQDYPIQRLDSVEKFLAETELDGLLHHFKVFSEESNWKAQEGYTRYHYHYRTVVENLSNWQTNLLNPLKVLNYIQPFFRVNFSYGFMLGLKTIAPFDQNFVCYGGSSHCTLSRKCVEFLVEFVKSNPEIVTYYQRVAIPDESFIHTILVNARSFKLCADNYRYYDFSRSRNGHPRILSTEDFPSLAQNHAHFARKFDPEVDSDVLDLIDQQLLQLTPSLVNDPTLSRA